METYFKMIEATFTLHIETGERIEIGDDRDGLNLAEIRFYTDDNTLTSEIKLRIEKIPMMIEALKRFHDFKINKE